MEGLKRQGGRRRGEGEGREEREGQTESRPRESVKGGEGGRREGKPRIFFHGVLYGVLTWFRCFY
jgi:hypothetical protein